VSAMMLKLAHVPCMCVHYVTQPIHPLKKVRGKRTNQSL